MHLHSILWYLLVVATAGVLYTALSADRRIAAVATLLFALDYTHGGTVAWIANRNILIGLVLSLGALYCYQRRGLLALLACAVLFALSLACGEAALAISGYFLGYELFLSARPLLQRLLRLAVPALVSLAGLVYWHVHGYGAAGPGFYVDPFNAPGYFLHEALLRFPAYLMANWLLPPAEVFGLLENSAARPWLLAFSVAGVLAIGTLLWRRLGADRRVCTYATGMLVAVVPICGIIPVSRSLWYVGFGVTGILATYLMAVLAPTSDTTTKPAMTPMSGLQRGFAKVLLVMHLLLSPLLFVGLGLSLNLLDQLSNSTRLRLPDQDTTPIKVLVLADPDVFGNITLAIQRDQALSLGRAATRRPPSIAELLVLTPGKSAFRLSRPADDVLIAECRDGFHLWPTAYPRPPQTRFDTASARIHIDAYAANGRPQRIRYDFAHGSLATFRVLDWSHDHFAAARLPAPGQTMTVAAH